MKGLHSSLSLLVFIPQLLAFQDTQWFHYSSTLELLLIINSTWLRNYVQSLEKNCDTMWLFPFTLVLSLVSPFEWKSRGFVPDVLESVIYYSSWKAPPNDYICFPGNRQLWKCPAIACTQKHTITQLAIWRERIRARCGINQMKTAATPSMLFRRGKHENIFIFKMYFIQYIFA